MFKRLLTIVSQLHCKYYLAVHGSSVGPSTIINRNLKGTLRENDKMEDPETTVASVTICEDQNWI
jgi:hypothetical protein